MAWCDRCDRWFRSDYALDQHIRDSSAHWMCWTCDRDFTNREALTQHQKNSSRHSWCDGDGSECGVFDSQEGMIEHCEEAHWFCVKCLLIHQSENSLNYHLGTEHNYCSECRRFFMDANNLKMHLNSKLHKIANVPCFGGARCGKKFITISDAILRIENGYCPSGLTGASLRRFFIRNDRGNIVTNPSRLIGYDTSGTNSQSTRYATEQSRNVDGWYECVLCPKEFTSLRALNAHYSSSVHEARVFRCPNHGSGCAKHFSTLSGVIQHIEDGYCGARKSRHVQDRLDSLMSNMGRLRLTDNY